MEQLFRFLQSSKLQVYFSFRSLNQKYLYLSCNSISDSHDTNQKLADFMKAIKIDLYIRSKPLYISDFIKLFQKKLLSPIQFLKYEEILRFFPFKHELPQGMSKDSKSSVILHIQDLGFFEMDSDIYASNGSHCKLLIFLKLDLQKLQEFLDRFYITSSFSIIITNQEISSQLKKNTHISELKKIDFVLDSNLDQIDELLNQNTQYRINPDNNIIKSTNVNSSI